MEPSNVFPSQRQWMTCFKCQSKGHWAKDCPLRSLGGSPSESTPSNDIPILYCGCGAPCAVRTSTTLKNPNRNFYICLKCSDRKKSCFGGWCDEFDDVPDCPCRIGKCRIYTASEFDNRKFYGCRIKRGFGCCDFRKLVNDQRARMMETEPPAVLHPAEPAIIDLDADIDDLLLSNEFHETVLSMIASKQHPHTSGEAQRMVIEDGSGNPSPDSALEDLTIEELVALDQISQNEMGTSQMRPQESDIHRRQEDFTRQVLAVGDGLTEDTFKLFLGLQVIGWCGHIVFQPSRMITEPPAKPFFCCIFPSLCAMIESNDMAVIDSPLHDSPSSSGPMESSCRSYIPSNSRSLSENFLPSDASCLSLNSLPFNDKQVMQFDCPKMTDGEQVMQLLDWLAHRVNSTATNQLPGFRIGGRYTELLQRTAADVQNQFIALLDTVNPLDIDRLRNEAVVCFTTLGLLRALDCGEFICRVMHYIECASSLAKIQRSVDFNPSLQLQELRALHITKQKHHEDISRMHMEKSNACSASEERCRMLKQNAARLREMLRQTESEIAQCEVDLAEQERSLVGMNQEVKKSRKSMEAAAREVVEAQHKEMERAAAKDALQKARSLLGN